MPVDALSDVLRVIRLSGGVFLEAHLSAPWCFKGRLSPEDCKAFNVAPSLDRDALRRVGGDAAAGEG